MRTTKQVFTYREIPRNQITPAPYNPRTIGEEAQARLRENLARVGLLTTLVWNERSGHLVSGHQRLTILDELTGSLDYTVGVAVVNLDDQAERELNVFLNNTWAQGEFDTDHLMALVAGQGPACIEAMGWTADEVLLEFGAREELQALRSEASPAARRTAQDTLGPHVLLIFRTNVDKEQFLAHLGRPDMKRLSADELHDYVKAEARWR